MKIKHQKFNYIAKSVKAILIVGIFVSSNSCDRIKPAESNVWTKVQTVSGINREFSEPFGIAVKDGEIYVSDGEQGSIIKITRDGKTEVLTDEFDTPSQIAFDKNDDLIVADSGSHTIKKVLIDGKIELVAGVENRKGFGDGNASEALFNAPIGIAVAGDKIFVADTYNDLIRVIENGEVSTFAGSDRGFANGYISKFDTPNSLAIWTDNRMLVADAGNRRIRVIEQDGRTWTLTGNGSSNLIDGLPGEAVFVQPTALAVDKFGAIYAADGNAIRVIGRGFIPNVQTISNDEHGFYDGSLKESRFNRPSGLAFDEKGNLLVADSDNQLIRVITGVGLGKTVSVDDFDNSEFTAEEFRALSEPRWPFEPAEKKREIAGTVGEIRGELDDENSNARFHNGLDIVGSYGEKAYIIKDEKVLRPLAVQNFETTRELLRMPTLGYIHIRLGRDKDQEVFEDERFQFEFDEDDKPIDVRLSRGTKFKAGDVLGTLNEFNHVHLIAGRTGREMNALDALIWPEVSDETEPKIENVRLYDENWDEFETAKEKTRIKLVGKIRIVVRAFDQMDGNAERRKLGLYKIGYQVFDEKSEPLKTLKEPKWNIIFDRSPENDEVKFVYARGSRSGATGETIFRYIATNEVSGKIAREGFFDTGDLEKGKYTLKVLVADFFGNTASEDIDFEIE